MSIPSPLLFRRQTLELLAEIEKALAVKSPDGLGWQTQKGGPGQGMVKLFGRFLDIIVARLNKAPQQHFLAYLSEGGIDQLPPIAATTQLLFTPEKDARPAIPIPAGTQVATRASGDQEEIVFETEHDIHVIPTELVRCFAMDQRTFADRTSRANGDELGSFAAFRGEQVRKRLLYVRDDTVFTFPDNATREHSTVTLVFELDPTPPAGPAGAWQLEWFYYQLLDKQDLEKNWLPLTKSPAKTVIIDDTDGLRRSGEIRVAPLPEQMDPVKLDGDDDAGMWLRCQLTPTSEAVVWFPQIRKITIRRETVVPEQPVAPTLFTSGQAGLAFTPLKPEDPFYPFSQFPAALDGFYVAADEAFSKPGATVELAFVGDGLPPNIDDTSSLEALTVAWEYHSEQGWQSLGTTRWGCPALQFADLADPRIKSISTQASSPRSVTIELDETLDHTKPPDDFPPGTLREATFSNRLFFDMDLPAPCMTLPPAVIERGRAYHADRLSFTDTTCAFTGPGPGAVSFKVPSKDNGSDPAFAAATVNGQSGLWIRARIVDGAYEIPQAAPSGLLGRLFVGNIPPPPAKPAPPLECQLQLKYRNYVRVEGPRDVAGCRGRTDGGWQPYVAGAPFAPFTTPTEQDAVDKEKHHAKHGAERAALYLGFRPLDAEAAGKVAFPPNTWVKLYLGVDETGDERTNQPLQWEYSNGATWQPMSVIDQTLDLWRSGTLGFFGPPDHRSSTEFGVDAFWLRVWPEKDGGSPPPRVGAVRLNVVPTINGETVLNEILGSSTAQKSQVFELAWPPVSPDIDLEVQEPNEKTEASDSIWVPWERVPDLLACGPTSRCYTLDPTTGRLTFGDGVHGAIPPAGRENIIVRRYRSHWGAAGNLGANTVIVLRNPKGPLNEIRRVANPEPAAGGADLEETALVEQRGPFSLKNRSRAIAPEDYEWLGREVAGARRVYCLPTRKSDGTRAPGWVTVVVVPGAAHTAPGPPAATPPGPGAPSPSPAIRGGTAPAPSLLREVREYLAARALANLAGAPLEAVVTAETPPDLDQIHVTGAGFVEVAVHATVTAKDRSKSDSTRQDVLKQLAEFLDPVDGGPDRQGWEPGRSVYLSEVKAEIENVPGVDHVGRISLAAPSRLQQSLIPAPGTRLAVAMPPGSQVSTFDERIKGLLLTWLLADTDFNAIPVGSFNDGDLVTIARPAGASSVPDLGPVVRRINLARPTQEELAKDPGLANQLDFDLPFDFADRQTFDAWVADPSGAGLSVAAENGRVTAPVDATDGFCYEIDPTGRLHLLAVRVARFADDEPVSLVDVERRGRRADFIPIRDVSPDLKLTRVFVPGDQLVCSGSHDITMAL